MLKSKALMSILFIFSLFILSAAVVAQDGSESSQFGTQADSTQHEGIDQSTQGIDQSGQQTGAVDELANDLANQLALDDEQKSEVKSILTDYQDNVRQAETGMEREGSAVSTEQARSEADEQISEVLRESQKATWENMKDTFWSNVDSQLGTSDTQYQESTPETTPETPDNMDDNQDTQY